MIKTIDMAHMRYINLFQKISHVSPQHCFIYNSAIILAVPESQLKKAMGDNGRNLKKMSEILGKKIKVVLVPDGIGDAEKFIEIEVDGVVLPRQRMASAAYALLLRFNINLHGSNCKNSGTTTINCGRV